MPRGKHPCSHRRVDRWDGRPNWNEAPDGAHRRVVWCCTCGAMRMEYLDADKDGEDRVESHWLYWRYPSDAYKTGRLAPWGRYGK